MTEGFPRDEDYGAVLPGTASGWITPRLEGWANQIAGKLGAPVYLVGSALREKYVRDVDVVVILSQEDFVARYGPPETWMFHHFLPNWSDGSLRWATEIAKVGAEASRNTSLNIDFKIQPLRHAISMYSDRPRLRLDKLDIPEVIPAAGDKVIGFAVHEVVVEGNYGNNPGEERCSSCGDNVPAGKDCLECSR